MYLLDSCVCIDLMRGKLPYGYSLMRQSDPKLFGVPAVVVAGLEFGIARSANPRKNRLLTERFLAPYAIVPFDGNCARAYGKIRDDLRHKDSAIGPNDLLIAATALANQATLVSNNRKEFIRIDGLAFESWYEIDLS